MPDEKPDKATETPSVPGSPETPTDQETKDLPSGITDALHRYEESQKAEETKPDEKIKPGEETKPSPEKKADETPEKPKGFLLKDGDDEFALDVEISGPDMEKARTWLQQGKNYSQSMKDLKEREKHIDVLEEVRKQVEEGRLVPKDQVKPPDEGPAKLEIDYGDVEEDYPEVMEHLKRQDGERAELKQQLKQMGELVQITGTALANQFAEKAKGDLDSQIATAREKYPIPDGLNDMVWNLLALKEGGDKGPPKYNAEQAVKHVHDEIDAYTKGTGKYVELTDDKKQEIFAEEYEKVKKANATPTSSPAGLPAGADVKTEKKEFSGITEAVNAAAKDLGSAFKTGAKY